MIINKYYSSLCKINNYMGLVIMGLVIMGLVIMGLVIISDYLIKLY